MKEPTKPIFWPGKSPLTPPVQGGAAGGVRLKLTKNPPCSFNCSLPDTWHLV